MEALKGLGVALVTPFDANGQIDYNSLEKLLQHTAYGGVDYWVVMGSTGEAATISESEQVEVLKFVQQNNPTNIPIVLGLGGNNTSALLNRLKELDLSSVTALLSASPAYNKPSQQGIINHFEALADNSPIPVLLYNVPGRTSSNMEAATTIHLSQHGNICGIKEASGDLMQIMEIINNTPDNFIVTSGDDLLTPAILGVGGDGLISVLANAMPKEFKSMVNRGLQGDLVGCRKEAMTLKDINDLMYKEGNPTGIKELLRQKEICLNYVRQPLLPASGSISKEIEKVIKKGG